MKVEEILEGLQDLVLDRESFLRDDDYPDNRFAYDAKVLKAAIAAIKTLYTPSPEKGVIQIAAKKKFAMNEADRLAIATLLVKCGYTVRMANIKQDTAQFVRGIEAY
jgi:hypothetical protein